MKVRFEQTPDGEIAILSRDEYELLLAKAAEAGAASRADEAEEDAGTARLVDRARQELAEGGILVPMDVVSRLADGENAVRVLRLWRGQAQTELAARSGLSQGYISDIEKGRRIGTPTVLRHIADALGVPLDLLA